MAMCASKPAIQQIPKHDTFGQDPMEFVSEGGTIARCFAQCRLSCGGVALNRDTDSTGCKGEQLQKLTACLVQ